MDIFIDRVLEVLFFIMREKERIERILKKIKKIWKNNPDFRLMQLLISAIQPKEPHPELFYLEDDNLEKKLEICIEQKIELES